MTDETTTDQTVTDETAAADPVVETASDAAPAATTEAPKAKGKKGKAAAAEAEADPTLEEAEAMFKERPGLDTVRTQAGWLSRDGQLTVLTPALAGE